MSLAGCHSTVSVVQHTLPLDRAQGGRPQGDRGQGASGGPAPVSGGRGGGGRGEGEVGDRHLHGGREALLPRGPRPRRPGPRGGGRGGRGGAGGGERAHADGQRSHHLVGFTGHVAFTGLSCVFIIITQAQILPALAEIVLYTQASVNIAFCLNFSYDHVACFFNS